MSLRSLSNFSSASTRHTSWSGTCSSDVCSFDVSLAAKSVELYGGPFSNVTVAGPIVEIGRATGRVRVGVATVLGGVYKKVILDKGGAVGVRVSAVQRTMAMDDRGSRSSMLSRKV